LGFTWSSSINLENIKKNEKKSFKFNFDEGNKRKVKNIFVKFCHNSEELNKPMRGIKDNGIHEDVLKRLIIV